MKSSDLRHHLKRSLKDVEEGMNETDKMSMNDSSEETGRLDHAQPSSSSHHTKTWGFGSAIGLGEQQEACPMCDEDDEECLATQAKQGEAKQKKKLNKKNKRKGSSGSKMVYAILFIAALGLGLATYYLLSTQQQSEFESDFESYARETSEIAENNAANAFGQLRTLATVITSIAYDTNEDTGYGFPNVTVPHFDLRAQEIASLTGAEMLLFAPFVEQTQKAGWEEYERANRWWIEQDYVSTF